MRYFESTHWIYMCLIVMAICAGGASLFLYLIRRYIRPEKLKSSHDVVGFTYSIIGVVYAVLLGFTVVNVQDRFNDAKLISETEANCVADLYRDAAALGRVPAEKVRGLIMTYIDQVIQEEWPLMDQGRTADSVIETVRSLWETYYSIQPKDDREKIWLAESVKKLNEFTNIRLQRIYNSNDSLSPILWALLYFGAAITLSFLGFFYVENFRLHLIVMILLSSLIGFSLFLIQTLDSVYYGSISVSPTSLLRVQQFLMHWY